MQQEVLAWVEKIMIPTYGIGEPEKNPIFLEKRVYQGSRGSVYPYPVVEKIYDEKTDKEYTAVFIENEYLKIMVLPELGGRIQRAYDKIRNRDFIYYNQVIKPALVGLTGPWISGGIEFNWPQHHRPSTFNPVDFSIETFEDESKTIWVNEVELMTRTKGMAGYTLYPGKAYLEIKGRIFNRTPFTQTFLWWANPAVKVNDDYQSVFPPDVYAVFDHGKRDVSDFPIATGVYYKVDYSPGTDISRYKNIPVPTSYMAIQSKYNFIGCYEHDTQAGMLHVADHHISPGKKQWTWGKGDFGIAWDRNLTDEDGPYIELMCGVYTDNQPDFSWIQPNEEKTFEQYFMPYAEIGLAKNASKDAVVNVEVEGKIITLKLYVTSRFKDATIKIKCAGNELLNIQVNLSPERSYITQVDLNENGLTEAFVIEVYDHQNNLLIDYKPEKNESNEIPPAATAAKLPEELESNELLYLNGIHLEQYRHATYSPTDYYLEALKRDPEDIRCNNAMGVWLMRRGKLEKAEPYFRAAVKRTTLRNPNPYDGEPYYNLGVCLKMQGKNEEAYESLYKSAWNDAWQHSAYYQLASLAAKKMDFINALYLVDKSLNRNYNSHSARHLKITLLRKLKRYKECREWIDFSLKIDPFNFGAFFEKYLLSKEVSDMNEQSIVIKFKQLIGSEFNNYTEYCFDYRQAGFYQEAFELISLYGDSHKTINPMWYYYLGALCFDIQDENNGLEYFKKAAVAKPDYCFPSKVEDIAILSTAIRCNPADAKAYYYLGNFWYANGQFNDAIENWQASIHIDPSFPTVHRNISLAYYNKLHDEDKGRASLEHAFALDTNDARLLMELDQLHKLQNKPPYERLQLLQAHASLVEARDDIYLERIILYNQLGEHEQSLQLLNKRRFHPWEGGEGKTVAQYLLSLTELAKKAILNEQYTEALELLSAAEKYPENLGEGKLPGAQDNDILFLQGVAYESLKLKLKADVKFTAATNGISEPVQAIFYNDPQPDKIVYQGLSWKKLGNVKKAGEIFKRLIEFGTEHINDDIKIDYFAVSLPDLQVFDQDLSLKNKIHCIYLTGLGYLGLEEYIKAEAAFNEVLKHDINHQGAIVHLKMPEFLKVIFNCSSFKKVV